VLGVLKLFVLLKIHAYKGKQIHIQQRHLCSLSPLLRISAHPCHPHRYHRPNLNVPKILQITNLILILCSFQQPNSKGRVVDIHKHIWVQYIIKLFTFAVDIKIYKKKKIAITGYMNYMVYITGTWSVIDWTQLHIYIFYCWTVKFTLHTYNI
jgi:hypothetical protein